MHHAPDKAWPAATTVMRKIDDLKPYPKNPRTHSKHQIGQIAESMKQWGWTMPILADDKGQILAGHGRVEAARLLNYDDVPVIIAKGWTAAQKRAYVIADNRLAETALWDDDLLAAEFAALQSDGFDMRLMGFDDAALAAILTRGSDPLDPNEAWVGMPAFKQDDKSAFRTIHVHFASQEAVDAFADLVDSTVTDRTDNIWFPHQEQNHHVTKRYVAVDD